MSTQAIASIGNIFFNNAKYQSLEASENQENSAASSSTQRGTYSNSPSLAAIQQRVEDLLADIEPDGSGRITIDAITQRRDDLLEEFKETIKSDLRALGVDENIQFTLGTNPSTGRLMVSSDHADASKVEAYLAANPELNEQYDRIQTLDSFTRMAENKLPVSTIRKQYQADLVSLLDAGDAEDWFSGTTLMNYSAGDLSTFAGLNLSV